MSHFIPFQSKIRQPLPVIRGSKDYHNFRYLFDRIDEILIQSGIEEEIVSKYLEVAQRDKYLSYPGILSNQDRLRKALRCAIARNLTRLSFRKFSVRVADSPILQRFLRINDFDIIRVPSKSQCQRYEELFSSEMITHIIVSLNQSASHPDNPLNLVNPVSLKEVYIDSTCVDANIHFPVDWVLLRDAVKTLMKATILIRNKGLKHRMKSPEEFLRSMNRLCIEITHTRRKKHGKRHRKRVLRLMKKLCQQVAAHAMRHMTLLMDHWQNTDWSEYQAYQIVSRMELILEQLPQAIYQAHERIIGERRVPNAEKILSLYEREIHVIVRGKASGETEFGNTLLLAEQSNGIIVDWEFFREQAPSDSHCLIPSLRRLKTWLKRYPDFVTGDRGFHSKTNEKYLAYAEIHSAICPKSIRELKARLLDAGFARRQRRRGQTEGRIGIIQNVFLGNPFRSKGYPSRRLHVGLAILTHNLWVVARLPKAEEEKIKERRVA